MLLVPLASFAQSRSPGRDGVGPGRGIGAAERHLAAPVHGIDGRGRLTAEVETCLPLCPADTNPCHPIHYKTADGRCSDN